MCFCGGHTYVLTYVHTSAYVIHTYIHTCMHTYIHTCICICIYIYIHKNTCIHTYICITARLSIVLQTGNVSFLLCDFSDKATRRQLHRRKSSGRLYLKSSSQMCQHQPPVCQHRLPVCQERRARSPPMMWYSSFGPRWQAFLRADHTICWQSHIKHTHTHTQWHKHDTLAQEASSTSISNCDQHADTSAPTSEGTELAADEHLSDSHAAGGDVREKAIAVEINELSKNSANVQAQLEALHKNLKALEATGHDALQV